ncbi:hypothetical protein GCM10023168_01560 [Fodinibacter luteus]|uniref:Phosphatidic acid phosphatase type 2/haloperoxidase domain-containing protein n=1 Tax=Fodinibacter luteus TaxID=552064 RepID=A0ABP8JWA0_9MICO
MTAPELQAGDVSARAAGSPRRPPGGRAVATAAVALGVLLALSALVASGSTVPLDDRARELFRPNDEWGALQVRVDTVVEGLRPRITGALVVVLAVVLGLVRRSWWPVLSVAAVVTTGALLTLTLKGLVGRADTHGDLGALGGSYPSGHVVMVLLLGGCTALLVREHPGPLAWSLVGLGGAVMAWALLVQTAHWLTDVVGGVLVGVVVLALAPRLPFTPASGSATAGPPRRSRAARTRPR